MMFLADISPNFSPFIVCVLEKCLRLLSSESGSFTLPEKSMISFYVSTTLKYILETQVSSSSLIVYGSEFFVYVIMHKSNRKLKFFYTRTQVINFLFARLKVNFCVPCSIF